MTRFRSILACLAGSPLLIGASEPIHLQPSSNWNLDYGENTCRLIRLFGQGDDYQTTLIFESIGPGDQTLLVAGRPLHTTAGAGNQAPATTTYLNGFTGLPGEAPAVVKFLPGEHSEYTGHSATAANHVAAAYWDHVWFGEKTETRRYDSNAKVERPPPADASKVAARRAADERFLAAVDAMEIDVKGAQPVVLETGNLKAPADAFDQCTHDLLLDFGLDLAVQAKIVRPPWTDNMARILENSGYPRKGLAAGQQSSVSIRLRVDAKGDVTKCASVSQFNAPAFNEAVCNAFSRNAHFEPAELADGTKVPSYVVQHVIFRLQ